MVACAGCSGADEPESLSVTDVSVSVALEAVVFPGWRPAPASWMQDLRRRTDPLLDGWPTEFGAALAERELERWLSASLDGGPTPSLVAELVADDVERTGPFLPAAFDAAFEDGPVVVRDGRITDEVVRGREALERDLAAWRDALDGRRVERVACRALEVEPDGKHGFRTLVRLRVLARGAHDALQHDVAWQITWRIRPNGGIEIARLAVRSFRAACAPALFEELTGAVFGDDAAYRAGCLQGTPALLGRQDRLDGETFLGMQGLAVGDLDGDGLEDVVMPQSGGLPNLLFLRDVDGRVREVGAERGLDFLDHSFGALIVDLDGDGARDVVTSLGARVVISWNDGRAGFHERSVLAAADPYSFYSASAADADGDGDLDLYAVRYMAGEFTRGEVPDQAPVPYHDADNGASNFFWRNEGERRLVDATAEVGLDRPNRRFSLASIWDDFDQDGDLDLYVANDFGRNNLFRNDGGHFVDVADTSAASDMAAGMGLSAADVDLDGDDDLIVSNMHAPAGMRVSAQPAFMAGEPALREHYLRHARGNTILLNEGDLAFSDGSEAAGMSPGGWSWGARFFDWNADGLADIYVPNGFITGPREDDLESYFWRRVIALSPTAPPASWAYYNSWDSLRILTMQDGWSWNGHERNYAYLNIGGGRFADLSALSGADLDHDGRAVCGLDWDGDGRQDLLVRSRTGPRLRLLRNAWPGPASFLELELRGAAPNPDAIGACVRLTTGGVTLRRSVHAGDGLMSSSSTRLAFGLSGAQRVERIAVRWPDGSEEVHEDVAANRCYVLVQGANELAARATPAALMLEADVALPETPPRARLVLADALPMRGLSLTGRGDLEHLAGGAATLMWLDLGPDAVHGAAFEALCARAVDLQRESVRCIVLVGDAHSAEAVRERLAGADALVADEELQTTLRMFLIEVLGPFDGLPLPVALVLAPGAELVALHFDRIDVVALAQDLATVAAFPDPEHVTERLAGGRWLVRPERSLGMLGQVFQRLGRTQLARSLELLEEERRHARAEEDQGSASADQPAPAGSHGGGL